MEIAHLTSWSQTSGQFVWLQNYWIEGRVWLLKLKFFPSFFIGQCLLF